MKSEPDECSFDDALDAPAATVPWTGEQALRKTRLIPLAELRQRPELANMRVLQRGNRLLIMPEEERQWRAIEATP